jgi:hypothetical protein
VVTALQLFTGRPLSTYDHQSPSQKKAPLHPFLKEQQLMQHANRSMSQRKKKEPFTLPMLITLCDYLHDMADPLLA